MTDRLKRLKGSIDQLYLAKHPERGDWADWLYADHIFVVAEYAGELAARYGAKKDLAMAAGMLHDIADAVMSRFDSRHEAESVKIARQFLGESGFSDEEIRIVVDDAIRFHSCHDEAIPSSPEGKVMATADALAHLKTDFYPHAVELRKQRMSMDEIRAWALPKIERDFQAKIRFDEVREAVRPDYERLKKTLFA